MNSINLRTPKTFGCSIVATILIQSLRERFPDIKINIYTEAPDLFQGLEEINDVFDVNTNDLEVYDINLKDYVEETNPQNSLPLRHLSDHIFEVAEKQLDNKLETLLNRNFYLKVNLTDKENADAKAFIESIYQGKPIIWLQTKTSESGKDWPQENWDQLFEQLSSDYTLLELTPGKFSRRTSIAITKYCDAGIVLDSFLLHGSEAVHAKNTIVILMTTHAPVVTYPDQIVLEEKPDVDDVYQVLKTLNLS